MNLNKISLFLFKCLFLNFLIFISTKLFVSIYLNTDFKVTKARHQIQQEISSNTDTKFSKGHNLLTSFINSLEHKLFYNISSSAMSFPEIKIKLNIFVFFVFLGLLYLFSIYSRAPPLSLIV